MVLGQPEDVIANASMCWAKSRAMAKARAHPLIGVPAVMAGSRAKPIPRLPRHGLHTGRKLLEHRVTSIATTPKDRCDDGRRQHGTVHPSCLMTEVSIARMNDSVNACGRARSQHERDRGHGLNLLATSIRLAFAHPCTDLSKLVA